jgi:hypothetical protein
LGNFGNGFASLDFSGLFGIWCSLGALPCWRQSQSFV